MKLVRVSMATHLRRSFDYILSDSMEIPPVGGRVRVPFGTRQMIAIVIELPLETTITPEKLRSVSEVLDQQALFDRELDHLLKWASRYYHYNLGDVYFQMLPALLRKGEPDQRIPAKAWSITESGKERLAQLIQSSKAPKQRTALQLLEKYNGPFPHQAWEDHDISTAILRNLRQNNWIQESSITPDPIDWQRSFELKQEPPKLNQQQAIAVAAITHRSQPFTAYLLDGVTGSGKTEVYLQLLEPILSAGKQALILVPEIGLTPQTIARFRQRFNVPIAVLHSALNDRQRLDAWLDARSGDAAIIIGTRSALFTPLKEPGIIIIDEEHDPSLKQQDTFRYHARDVALMRAKLQSIPIVLGTATPSLETLQNALDGRYQHLKLTQRAGHARPVECELIDIRHQPLRSGLCAQLIESIRQTLEQGQQVMLFLNRRGYAPAMLCHECGEVIECQRCERFYTYHQHPAHLACHHCGSQKTIPQQCPHCGSTQLVTTGIGTEQLEQQISELFPEYSVARIDRDSTRTKGSLDRLLNAVHTQQHQILIGTQMLAKGHHFPNVTLVAIVDIDNALFSSDFRAAERLAQLFIQVSGRAGRANLPGKVLLQTHHPEHELLQDLVNNGYEHFAKFALKERQLTQLPPFCHQALIRFESSDQQKLQTFAEELTQRSNQYNHEHHCFVFPVIEAPIPKRAGKIRMQQLLQATHRRPLHQLVHLLIEWLETAPSAKRVRWSVDVDPIDML